MDKERILQAALKYIDLNQEDEHNGHGYWHIRRVEALAVELAEAEKADIFTTRLAALLHDLDDYKLGGDEKALPLASRFLNEHISDRHLINRILEIIRQVSFKGAKVHNQTHSPEADCVQDADRLDAIGAIGIARTFAYGGSKNRRIYDPSVKPVCHTSYSEYQNNTSPTINHFYEKLLLLKDRMKTQTGRKIAEKRHAFMEEFLRHFYEEWQLIKDKNK